MEAKCMHVLNRAERRLVKSGKLTCLCKYGVVRLFNNKGDMVAEKIYSYREANPSDLDSKLTSFFLYKK